MDAWQKFLEEMVGKSNVKKLQECFGYYFGKDSRDDPAISLPLNKNHSTKP